MIETLDTIIAVGWRVLAAEALWLAALAVGTVGLTYLSLVILKLTTDADKGQGD